jgi:2-keto-3-deoxy-L-rhamnonate aldolase RhmA
MGGSNLGCKPNRVREVWRGGGTPIGSFVFSRASSNVEIVGRAGFDFVILDMEHAPLELGEVESHVRAADLCGIAPLVRVPALDQGLVGKLLDLGAEGILLPHFGIDRAAARAFAACLRYAPAGHRPSCTGVRAAGYTIGSYADYVKHANAEVLGIGLVEDIEAVADLDAILAESRIDAVMPGPGDLSTSMGVPGQPTHPRVREAVVKIMTSARKAGLRVGMYLNSVAEAADWPGVDFYVYMMDVKVLAIAYTEAAKGIRAASKKAAA